MKGLLEVEIGRPPLFQILQHHMERLLWELCLHLWCIDVRRVFGSVPERDSARARAPSLYNLHENLMFANLSTRRSLGCMSGVETSGDLANLAASALHYFRLWPGTPYHFLSELAEGFRGGN